MLGMADHAGIEGHGVVVDENIYSVLGVVDGEGSAEWRVGTL